MDIKRPQHTNIWANNLVNMMWRRKLLRLAALLAVWGVGIAVGVYLQYSGTLTGLSRAITDRIDVVRERHVEVLSAVGSGLLATPERLFINMSFTHYEELKRQRAEALEKQVLTVTNEDYVSATLGHNGKSIPVKTRLKGDLTDHLQQGDKWSFRIKVKGDNTFIGMKQFSLHHPNARNYVYEWLFHRALHREDVLGLRYDFVTVTLNGRDLGVYALEEHFEKRLIEHNRRREGPIIRFSEERLWEEWQQQKIPFSGARQSGGGSYLASEIDAFQSQRWHSDPSDRAVHDQAVALLESFRRGERVTSEVFDVATLARFLAITDLMGAEHGARWHNTRFYYNAVSSRLEPIGFDGDSGKPITSLVYHMKDRHWSQNAWSADPEYFKSLFADPRLVEEYFAALQRVSQPDYLNDFFAEIQGELKYKLRTVHSEDPLFHFDKETLFRNQRYIQSALKPAVAIAAYHWQTTPGGFTLRLGNLQALPVEIVGVVYRDHTCVTPLGASLLAGRAPAELVEYTDVDVTLPMGSTSSEAALADVRVQFRIPGTGVIRDAYVTMWPFADTVSQAEDVMRKAPNVERFGFIRVNDASRSIIILSGDWTLTEDLVVPRGYTFKCGPGTRLHLNQSAMIVSYSRLNFIGEESAPIVIDSPDTTGQGLLVMTAPDQSILEQVAFRTLAYPSRSGWSLTGAVTVYESSVWFRDCKFVENHSEDALNVIRSEFVVSDCDFVGTQSDAFDADFCRGEIRDSTFQHCGNDGIDVSGSIVNLARIRVAYAADKGVSVGENSQVNAKDVSVFRSRVGIAIKDLSHLMAEDVRIAETDIGCAAYRKKPEFGPSSGVITRLDMQDVPRTYMIERGSKLHVDGNEIEGQKSQVARTLERESAAVGTSSVVNEPDPGAD